MSDLNALKKHLNKNLDESLLEDEVLELKEAKTRFDFDKLGQYFSALSNEAALRNVDFAYLVFGVDDKGRVVGTSYKKQKIWFSKIKAGGFDDTYNKDLVVDYFRKFKIVSRDDLNKLLENKLPEIFNEDQKNEKIKYLLKSLSKEGSVRCVKKGRDSKWEFVG